jgi:POT family proton-dependent oligopeptide transporter
MGKAIKLWALAAKGRWSLNPITTVRNMRSMDFWENVKPSKLGANKPEWMTFDDAWVDEVRRGIKACTVFCWYPFYWLTYNQMTNNLTSQAATMELNGVPNDLIQNIDPLALVIFIPICDQVLYPYLRKRGIRFTALKRIFFGFMLGVAAMIVAMIIQIYIYRRGPSICGKHMNTCGDILKAAAEAARAKGDIPLALSYENSKNYADINVWVQIPAFVLIAFSEIFASITGLEYAFTKAPKNMRSLVMSMFLFTNAVSSAIAQAFTPLSDDPLLVWNYASVAIIAFVIGILFWITHHKLDKEDDALNMLATGQLKATNTEAVHAEPEVEKATH